MRFYNAEEIEARLSMPALIDALETAFVAGHSAPPRLNARIPGGDGDRVLLAMPAFDVGGGLAVKLTALYPDNAARNLPVNRALIVMFSEEGAPEAALDGTIITHLRTGATSALASRYLSRADSRSLLLIGTGALAPYMALAHCAARPIEQIAVWGRDQSRAAQTVERVRAKLDPRIEVRVCEDLAERAARADIISCATSAKTPVLRGAWLRPGAFVDLVGAFTPDAREIDDDGVLRARVFVDGFAGAMEEAGDLLDPMRRGVIGRDKIEGELADLIARRCDGRRDDAEITLFKSVGAAIEDLAAARLAMRA